LAAASFRFWLSSSTRCTSWCSTGSSHSSHHWPCDQARAWLALTQPSAGAACFQCSGTGSGSIGVVGAKEQAASRLAAAMLISSRARPWRSCTPAVVLV